MTSWQWSLALIPPVGGTFLESREFLWDDQGQEQAGAGMRTLWERISDKCHLLYPASLISFTNVNISRPQSLLEHSLSRCTTGSTICEGCQLHHRQLSQHLNLANLLFGDWSAGSLFGGKPPVPAWSLGNPMVQQQQQQPAPTLSGGLPPLASSINLKKSNLFEDVAVHSPTPFRIWWCHAQLYTPRTRLTVARIHEKLCRYVHCCTTLLPAPTGKNGLGASFNEGKSLSG
ncbi:hypothetical protein K439DRAFT_116525 [Ramaria rubella]|nr:hypothetical protein K439DRAFT_116525 [Ramaria rubella]